MKRKTYEDIAAIQAYGERLMALGAEALEDGIAGAPYSAPVAIMEMVEIIDRLVEIGQAIERLTPGRG